MEALCYRAGREAIASIRKRGGVAREDVSALVLPAIGPKWLVLSGFDRALIRAGWFDAAAHAAGERTMLFGASAGAWRALALASREPQRALDALLDGYIRQRFTHADRPDAISGAYRKLLTQVLPPEDLAFALQHPRLALTLATVRARGLLARAQTADGRRRQAALLGAAGVLNVLSSRTQAAFFERVLFTSAAHTHPLLAAAPGHVTQLTPHNALDAALASGSVPLYMQPVSGIAGAPEGAYLDGGFSDYHLNRAAAPSGLTILFLHQQRIIPSWLDKFAPWRALSVAARERLLLVYPSPSFVRSLPGGAVPTRDDFQRFVHEPERRIERWWGAAKQSDALGSQFVADLESGALAGQVRGFG